MPTHTPALKIAPMAAQLSNETIRKIDNKIRFNLDLIMMIFLFF